LNLDLDHTAGGVTALFAAEVQPEIALNRRLFAALGACTLNAHVQCRGGPNFA